MFDKKTGVLEVNVVETSKNFLKYKIRNGDPKLPRGSSTPFSKSYENLVRLEQALRIIIPIALYLIFSFRYLLLHSIPTSFNVFSELFVAWSGGFIMLWLYSQFWFLDFRVFKVSIRELFRLHLYNLSVLVWIGSLAGKRFS
ncbi:MAG: hypothetical protein ACP5VS_18140 [Desulfomonilaceae bacterium]